MVVNELRLHACMVVARTAASNAGGLESHEALVMEAYRNPRPSVLPSTDAVAYRKHVVPTSLAGGIVRGVRTSLLLERNAR